MKPIIRILHTLTDTHSVQVEVPLSGTETGHVIVSRRRHVSMLARVGARGSLETGTLPVQKTVR
jgi:hypothetical protein